MWRRVARPPATFAAFVGRGEHQSRLGSHAAQLNEAERYERAYAEARSAADPVLPGGTLTATNRQQFFRISPRLEFFPIRGLPRADDRSRSRGKANGPQGRGERPGDRIA